MISLLGDIWEVISNIPLYLIYAAESVLNLVFAALETALTAAVAVLPGLPETVTPPSYVAQINWFFPLGDVLAVAAPMLSAYIVFLGVRWMFQKFGEL